jgi:hypothetical protein
MVRLAGKDDSKSTVFRLPATPMKDAAAADELTICASEDTLLSAARYVTGAAYAEMHALDRINATTAINVIIFFFINPP